MPLLRVVSFFALWAIPSFAWLPVGLTPYSMEKVSSLPGPRSTLVPKTESPILTEAALCETIDITDGSAEGSICLDSNDESITDVVFKTNVFSVEGTGGGEKGEEGKGKGKGGKESTTPGKVLLNLASPAGKCSAAIADSTDSDFGNVPTRPNSMGPLFLCAGVDYAGKDRVTTFDNIGALKTMCPNGIDRLAFFDHCACTDDPDNPFGKGCQRCGTKNFTKEIATQVCESLAEGATVDFFACWGGLCNAGEALPGSAKLLFDNCSKVAKISGCTGVNNYHAIMCLEPGSKGPYTVGDCPKFKDRTVTCEGEWKTYTRP